MKTWTTLLCCICVVGSGLAQNLIPNSGFESYYQCPSSFSYFGVKNFAPGWYSPSLGTPDLFNKCSFVDAGVPRNWAGVTQALEGNGYCGIYVWIDKINYREYLQAKLNERLIAGRTYRAELYFKLASYSKFAIDRIGILLSDSAKFYNHDQIINVTPTFNHVMDSALNRGTPLWNRVHFDYVAKGNEGFITIGNFSSDEETKKVYLEFSPYNEKLLNKAAYFFIDEVSLVEIDSTVQASALKDTLSIDENDVRTNEIYTLKHIRFSFDSYQLLPSSYPELNRLISIMKRNPKWRVELSGHTDDQGSAEYNLRLSQTRAITVSEYLVQNGVASERIRTRGFGKTKPIQESSSDEARALNRRVEAKFLD